MNRNDPNEAAKVFQVPDFIGDACSALASRVRGTVAGVTFDKFHKESASIIHNAIFGAEKQIKFSANNLIISSVDIQGVEPVDEKTLQSLQKSVQLAIEITTKSQEAAARHEAECVEQAAKGKLERQRLLNDQEAEIERKKLFALQAESETVATTGKALAEAKAQAQAAQINAEAAGKRFSDHPLTCSQKRRAQSPSKQN